MVTRIAVAGIGGRMGREIVSLAAADPEAIVTGGSVRSGTINDRDFASVTGVAIPDARVVDSIDSLLSDAHVLIDFTTASASSAIVSAALRAHCPLVVGTTGLTDEQVGTLRDAAKTIPVFYARNMSLGVNAVLSILPALVRALSGYDIEITEAHHRHKKDSPSGTALAIAEVISDAMNGNLKDALVYGREGIQPRRSGEIGMHSIRGGGNAGEHTVLFADEGEQIQLVHRAYSRRTFASGAVRAAHFTVKQKPGFFTMADLVGG